MQKGKTSAFKKRLAQLEKDHGYVERDFWFWVEHALHWNLALFALVAVLTYAYMMLNDGSLALAQVVSH